MNLVVFLNATFNSTTVNWRYSVFLIVLSVCSNCCLLVDKTVLPVESLTCVRDISRNVTSYYFVWGAMTQVIQGVSDYLYIVIELR